MVSQTLAQEVSQLEADLCFALADPTRILILYSLDEQSLNVTEITNALSITQPTFSPPEDFARTWAGPYRTTGGDNNLSSDRQTLDWSSGSAKKRLA